MGMLPDLTVALGEFPQTTMVFGLVGNGEAGEESHDCSSLEDCDTG